MAWSFAWRRARRKTRGHPTKKTPPLIAGVSARAGSPGLLGEPWYSVRGRKEGSVRPIQSDRLAYSRS